MKNKYWKAIHELYTKLGIICSKRPSPGDDALAAEEAAMEEDRLNAMVDEEVPSVNFSDLVAVRADIRTQLDFLKATLTEQYSERDTYLILFPIVAQIDEMILGHFLRNMQTGWPALQKELFQIDNAGEVFFEILDDILLKPQTALFIFEVYYFCLSYGFRGRYQDNPVKIKEYMKNLYLKLEQEELTTVVSEVDESGLISHLGSPYLGYLFSAGGLLIVYFVLVVAGRNVL